MVSVCRAKSVLCSAVLLLVGAAAIAQSSPPEFTTDDQQAILDADLTGWWAVIDRTDPRGSTAGSRSRTGCHRTTNWGTCLRGWTRSSFRVVSSPGWSGLRPQCAGWWR